MRNRFTWFVVGCVTGAVLLYVALWQGGVLSPYLEKVRAASRPGAVPAASLPSPKGPQVPTAIAPKPAQVPVEDVPAMEPAAEAPVASSGAIGVPIEGLKAADVLNTFSQSRPGSRPHEATDIMEPRGTQVHAMVDGVVKKLFLSKPGGITVYQFDDKEQYCYYYAHLDRYADGLKEGQRLQRGTVIGYVGSTGNAAADAPHLHLGISVLGPEKHWWESTPIDPYPILQKILQQ